MDAVKGYYKSPIGLIAIEGNGKAITGVSFCDENEITSQSDPVVQECVKQLDEYFKGLRRKFEISMNFTGTEFQNKVWKCLLEIDYGKKLSYQDISLKIGNIKACRAVGAAIGKNPLSLLVPCHRVVGKDGGLTGFAWGLDRKKWLLEHETNCSDFT